MSSDPHRGGNIQNEVAYEEHDHTNRAKRVNIVAGAVGQATVNINGSATIFAVVNTGGANTGNITLNGGPNQIGSVTISHPVSLAGNVTISDSKGFIGLVTANISNAVGNATLNPSPNYIGLVTADIGTIKAWGDPKTYIGLVTITGSLSAAAGNVTLDPGSKTQIVGNVTISDSKGYIGLVTSTPGSAWPDPKGYIGLVTITGSLSAAAGNVTLDPGSKTGIVGNITISDSKGFIGLVSVSGFANPLPVTFSGNVTISDSKTYIGLVTATSVQGTSPWSSSIVGNLTLSDSKGYIGLNTVTVGIGTQFIGLVTVVQSSTARTITGNLTLSDSKTFVGLVTSVNGAGDRFIGLVTSSSLLAGTTKTLLTQPVAFSLTSVATIVVPTNANSVYVTNLILSANATTQVRFKSGVTYLTGNASIGISLNPNGGMVMPGMVGSESWIGLPSGSLVIEKNDATTLVGGHVMYYQQ